MRSLLDLFLDVLPEGVREEEYAGGGVAFGDATEMKAELHVSNRNSNRIVIVIVIE